MVAANPQARVIWSPLPGSQEEFLRCPLQECLLHGSRGPGKSDALLMDFAQHVGQGHGAAWRGVIFRETYPQLADLVAKSEKWFRLIFPDAELNRSRMEWRFAGGETLMFRHMKRPEDYWSHHGQEYPWIAFDELCNWATPECYLRMFSCNRSSRPGVPRKIRAATNPYGKGTNWVRERFGLHGEWWRTKVIQGAKDRDGKPEPARAAIHGHLRENRFLLEADPLYARTVMASATNKAMAAAWLNGDWNVIAGGMFDDVWSFEHNVVRPFEVPATWRIDRAFDWGSSKPFSVGWYAESDGSDLEFPDGRVRATVRGDVFRIAEWYGSTGQPNEGLRMLAVDVAQGIVERELAWGWRDGRASRVKAGPADSAIFTVENGNSIAVDMEQPVRVANAMHQGVAWLPADKRPGSRKAGWEQLRAMIRAAKPEDRRPRETPGLFVVGDRCPHFMRTFLSLPRDERDPDDVDTDAEDHIADEVRYRIRSAGARVTTSRSTGLY